MSKTLNIQIATEILEGLFESAHALATSESAKAYGNLAYAGKIINDTPVIMDVNAAGEFEVAIGNVITRDVEIAVRYLARAL